MSQRFGIRIVSVANVVLDRLNRILFVVSVDKNGDVCISILHEPGDDKFGYEKASERWLPVHTVETILISVISMLADPNDESPANVDAAVSLTDLFALLTRTFENRYVMTVVFSFVERMERILFRI